jgi:tetratricopeptide (TPR) repeat protein
LNIEIPEPNSPSRYPYKGTPIEIEQLRDLKKVSNEYENFLFRMIANYGMDNQIELVKKYLNLLLCVADNPHSRALHVMKLGQLLLDLKVYESALAVNAFAYYLQPYYNHTWHILYNNLGECHNHFERYDLAESVLLEAINIIPENHIPYKNLGIALEGQGLFVEAAESFFQAIEKYSADPTSHELLKNLIKVSPRIVYRLPNFYDRMKLCERNINLTQNMASNLRDPKPRRRKTATPAGDPGINQ